MRLDTDLKEPHPTQTPGGKRQMELTFGPNAHLLLLLRRRGDATFAHRCEEDHAPTLLCLGQHQLFCRQHRNTLTADRTSCSYYGQQKSQGSFYLFNLIIGKLGPPSVGMCVCGVRAAVRVFSLKERPSAEFRLEIPSGDFRAAPRHHWKILDTSHSGLLFFLMV